MKLFVFSILLFGAVASNATQYNCKLTDQAFDSKPFEFAFDTVAENNKFVTLEDGSAVGCIVLRTTPSLITCGRGYGENMSNFVTSDDGSSVLGLAINTNDSKYNLSCVKQK